MRILFAEDDRDLSTAVRTLLERSGYLVDAVHDGAEAVEYAETEEYDGMILDWMMPEKDGVEALREMRGKGITVPCLLLTARDAVEDRVTGLDAGADDYLAKPFNGKELLARVRAMLRRREEFTPTVLRCGDVELNQQSAELRCGENAVVLPKLEYKLMELLMLNRGRCLSTEDMLVKVWGYETEADLGVVWVYLSYLRKRLAALGSRVEIKARRGIGYTLEEPK